MKRITAVILALLLCMLFSVVSFADNIYIVDDEEEEFIPDTQTTTTTTAPAETTTQGSIFGDLGDLGNLGSLGEYFNGFSGMFDGGMDSLLEGFDQLLPGQNTETTTQSALPVIDGGERPTQSQMSENLTLPDEESYTGQQQDDVQTTKEEELPSVLIVNGTNENDSGISGSTLTLLVFIAAIVILILVGAIVLVLMTRRTEYNSAVMDKSTIPGVDKPRAMSQFSNDNIGDDGNDYGNITYWND
ncbi:MAG: hypothetical protein J6Q94_06940 [Clostridia bacterium]|nr:hypothetical protein [Clostridia bacterium]